MANNGQSDVSICNLALSHLGERPITSLTEDIKAARECNRLYAITRDIELAAHNWNFAIKRTNLAEDGTAPDSEYGHRYQVPDEMLRLIEVRNVTRWRIEGGNLADSGNRFILTHVSGPIYIRYIERITDPAVFDVLFVDVLAARLALDLAEPLTQSTTKAEKAGQMYRHVLQRARSMDAIEKSPKQRPTSSWIEARVTEGANSPWSGHW